jgi:hypothetical protein
MQSRSTTFMPTKPPILINIWQARETIRLIDFGIYKKEFLLGVLAISFLER